MLSKITSDAFASRMFLLHPAEPPARFLLSSPTQGIYMGKTRLLHAPFFWSPKKTINPHMCVVGISGSGKSYFLKSFLTRCRLIWGTGALILDWAGEYNTWVRQAGGNVVELGRHCGINVLSCPKEKRQERKRELLDALEMLTDLGKYPQQRILYSNAIDAAYSRESDPTLFSVYKLLLKKCKGNDHDALQAAFRLGELVVAGGGLFSPVRSISMDELTVGLVCLDLHSLPSEAARSIVALFTLSFVKEQMRSTKYDESGIKLWIVADEAWKIAQDERSDLINIVREGRKYSFGLIVASQNPTDVHSTIFSNAGTMVIMRLALAQHRSYVQESLRYSGEIASAIGNFSVGEAAVHMVFSSQQHFSSSTFVLGKIDGEEPLLSVRLRGGKMDLELDRETFVRSLVRFGLSDAQVAQVNSEFERADYVLDVFSFVSLLEKFGFGRSLVVSFLRELGIKDASIAGIYAQLEMRKMGSEADKIARLVVSDAEIA
ncbi:ATP-binding protein [Candidatus Micrarchaeota archaeon]|nr:ATP-binding protein [Candidatus Micrarchaeota archaeon]